ncbi:MAG: iron ABC transporter permease [Bacilli bacterium]|nr:iron ABC transporter permease [Bacilli bacterium]
MQTKKKSKKFLIILAVLIFVLIAIFFVSMSIGRYFIPVEDVFKFFTFQKIEDTPHRVIEYLRLPRTLLAVLIGCSLAVSGSIYQSTFNNKLVSPDLLGVTSGASVGACLAILVGLSSAMTSVFAFFFGFVAVLLTVLLSKVFKNKSNIILILCGLAVGGLMSSLVGLMKYLADNEMKLAEMTFWLLGDLSKTTINDFWVVLPVTVIGCAVAIILSWRLNIISLGLKESKALGVNYKFTISLLILVATALTAVSVSVCGTIGWVGLVIPNVVRLFVGSNNKKVIPISILLGSIMMVIVDTLARSIAPNEIPLSIITGILGTPVFIFAIFRRRREIQ